MSEAENQSSDILLPGARVSVFSNDPETISSAALLQEDWRFARVDVAIAQGGVEHAIETYKTQTSPDLLIIQTDDINDAFIESLGTLSEFCEEGTAAIIVGPVNDVYLYRQLIEMGVSDYLVRPLRPEVLSEVIAKALITRLGVSDSRLIAFIGAKGGVGTSALAQIAAWTISEKLGHKTVLMDGAGGWSSLSVGMGFDPSATLSEVSRATEAKNEEALKRMIYSVTDKLRVVATGSDAMLDASISGQQYEAIINALMVKSPVVLVDLSAADSGLCKAVLTRAHQIIVVTTPTITSLRFCRSLIKEISSVRGGDADDVSLVVNKAGLCKAHEIGQSDIAEALEASVDATIAFVPNVFVKYESEIKKLLMDKEGVAILNEFLPVLSKRLPRASGEEEEELEKDSGFIGGFLSKLKSK